MNKENLFYILESGTNTRVFNLDGTPKIIDVTVDDDEVQRQGWLQGIRYAKRMSLKEYEEKFEDF